jgi:hypothetical protein
VLDEAWRVASSTHLENLAREGRAFGAGIAIGTQYPGDLPPNLSGALDTKIFLKNQQPDHKQAVVRALCGATSGPAAASLHSTLERLTQFEGLIQSQHYLPFAEFKLVPFFARRPQPRIARMERPNLFIVPAEPSTAKPTMGAAAVQSWLAEQLADGRRDGSDLKIAAAAAGVSLPGLYRAADALGVIREPIEGTSRKLWRLP